MVALIKRLRDSRFPKETLFNVAVLSNTAVEKFVYYSKTSDDGEL